MVINGFVNVVISSLERRFGLQSTQTGLIAGTYDIGSMLAVIPITYFGGRLGSSKPRYISLGLFLMGCGSFLFSLPHFITGRYLPPDFDAPQTHAEISAELCNVNAYFPDPDETDASCSQADSVERLVKNLSSYR